MSFDEEYPLADSSSIKDFRYLDHLIHSGEKEISLSFDIALGDEEASQYLDGIKIDIDGLVIDGEGHSIDACGKSRIFRCMGHDIIIKNIVLRNAFTNHDAGALLNEGSLEIYNSVFCDNVALVEPEWSSRRIGGGGAIYNRGTLKLSYSQFINNSSRNSGGAILNLNDLTIDESTFTKNTAEAGGGAILNNKSLKIHNSNFFDNSAKGNYILDYTESIGGGAVCNNGSSIIIKSTFSSNTSDNTGAGVLNLDEAIMMKSHFSNNNAPLGGGVANEEGNLTLTDSTFKNNSGHAGGGLFNTGDSRLSNSSFTGNTANNGGAIYTNNRLEITDSTLNANCGKGNDGGAAFFNLGCLSISNSKLSDNYAKYRCGAVYNNGHMMMDNTQFENNRSKGFDDMSNEGHLIINKSGFANRQKTILNNGIIHANEDISNKIENQGEINEIEIDCNKRDFTYLNNLISDSDGAVAMDEDIQFDVSNDFSYFGGIEITRDVAIDGNGHSIDAQGLSRIFNIKGGTVKLKNIELANGFATRGGAIHNMGFLEISESLIRNADAMNRGGAIFNRGNLKIASSNLLKNTAKGDGGIIFNKGNLDMTDSRLNESESLEGNGGAVYNSAGNLRIHDSDLCNDIANYGGAIYNSEGIVNIRNTYMSNNLAKSSILDDGGGAIAHHDGEMVIRSSKLSNNMSRWNADGGAIYSHGKLTIEDSLLDKNGCEKWGGAILNFEDMSISNSEFTNNMAGEKGGAIFNFRSLKIRNSKISHNYSKNGGGAIYNFGGICIKDSTLAHNRSEKGPVFWFKNGCAKIAECEILKNLSDENIIQNQMHLEIFETVIENNKSDYLILNEDAKSDLSISNCIFGKNAIAKSLMCNRGNAKIANTIFKDNEFRQIPPKIIFNCANLNLSEITIAPEGKTIINDGKIHIDGPGLKDIIAGGNVFEDK